MQLQNDAIKLYNDRLDPQLWDVAGNLRPEVSNQLLKIATEFYQSLEIKPKLHDVLLLGSAAGFNYSAESDIDIHISIDLKELDMPEEDGQKYVDALKSSWNDKHDIHIKNKNVEVYIQDIKHTTHANGIYSLMNAHWIKKPQKEDTSIIDKDLVKKKYYDMVFKIQTLEASKDAAKTKIAKVKQILTDLYAMRQIGLDSAGELSTENLVFKVLRHRGYIKRLKKIKDSLYDSTLSLKESIEGLRLVKEKQDRITRFFLYKDGRKIGKIAIRRNLITPGQYDIASFIVYEKGERGVGYGTKLINAAINDEEFKNKDILVKPEPYHDDQMDVDDLMKIYGKFGFKPWDEDLHYMILKRDKSLEESIKMDQINGVGAVPWNQEVGYRGFKRFMTPDEFLEIALPIYNKDALIKYVNWIKKEGLASPWLEVEWNKLEKYWRTIGHEGRHRMAAIKTINPNEKIEIHIFPVGMRARDLTPEMIKAPIKKQLNEDIMKTNELKKIIKECLLENMENINVVSIGTGLEIKAPIDVVKNVLRLSNRAPHNTGDNWIEVPHYIFEKIRRILGSGIKESKDYSSPYDPAGILDVIFEVQHDVYGHIYKQMTTEEQKEYQAKRYPEMIAPDGNDFFKSKGIINVYLRGIPPRLWRQLGVKLYRELEGLGVKILGNRWKQVGQSKMIRDSNVLRFDVEIPENLQLKDLPRSNPQHAKSQEITNEN
jgi:hypothetical protein